MQTFIDNDSAYLTWLSRNPTGFVVNCYRNPSPSYLTLHKAACGILNGRNRGDHWTKTYIKVCADDVNTLKTWASGKVGGTLHPCRKCNPSIS